MANEGKKDVNLVLVGLFSQTFLKENLDGDEYLQSHINKANQTIPMTAIFQVCLINLRIFLYICIHLYI